MIDLTEAQEYQMDQVLSVISLIRSGLAYEDVCERLDLSRITVQRIMRGVLGPRFLTQPTRYCAATQAEIRELLAQGLTYGQVAYQMRRRGVSVTRNSISGFVHRYGRHGPTRTARRCES